MINYKGKIEELEGLRGIAILLVTIHHFWPEADGIYESLKSFAHFGWIGVDLFFVISGFLIGGILLDTKGNDHYFKNFYARRILRIFPLYYAVVISLFIVIPFSQSMIHGLSYWETEFIKEAGNPLWYLTFTGNIRESITGVEPSFLLAPLWSLSIEEQFYLLTPLLIHSTSHKQLRLILFLFICVSPIFRYAMFEFFPSNERIQYLATISRFDNLSAGLLLALFVRKKIVIASRYLSHYLLLSTILIALIFIWGGFDRFSFFCRVCGYSFLAGYFYLVVFWTLENRNSKKTALLRNKFLMYIGSLCFGLYILQRPVEVFLVKSLSYIGFDLNSFPLLSLFAKTLCSIIVSQLVWSYFEKPINNLKRKFQDSKHPLAIKKQ